jgi:hypothetical protein
MLRPMSDPFVQTLEARRFLAGVTLIAHGYGGNVNDWVTAMGNAIAAQSGTLANQPRYLMSVTDPGHDGGPLSVASSRLGAAPANWGSDEIIVLLDWSDVAGSFPFGYERDTYDVGAAVATKLLSTSSIPDFTQPLAELPIHLIGHSRGASVVSEIAKGLGQHGVWVDQATYLDPHPVDGINDPLNLNYGDAPMRVYDNVQYAEDYWRTDGNGTSLDFTGEAVNGAYNLQLSESILSNGGYSIEHSDTHLWYHGTIGPPYSDSDGSATIGAGWYAAPQGPRDQTGWLYSRIARGVRPAAGLKSAAAHRDAVALTVSGASVWDDISIGNLVADSTLTQGTSLGVNVSFEDRSTGGTRDSTITLGFDRDDNPYNGVFNTGATIVTSTLGSDAFTGQLATANIAGAFRVYAKITNGVNTRYYYASGKQTITVPGYEKTWIGAATGDWSVASNWSTPGAPAAGDHVAIYDSAVTLPATTKIAGLLVGGSGSLDVGNHNLVIDYSSLSPLGTWTGSAYDGVAGLIASGKLRSSNVTSGLNALGVAEARDALNLAGAQTQLWSGQAVDASSVLVKFTYRGDANLDGRINVDDYTRIDFNVALGTSGWFNGDFNYDGKINVDDYTIIDFNVGIQGPIL